MKKILISSLILGFSMLANAEEAPESIQSLRDEIQRLKSSLAETQDQSVMNFSSSVELRTKYEAAVQRVKEANDVARQWRSHSINLKHELSYTKAIAQVGETVDMEKVFAKSKVPHFRIANIDARAEAVVRNDGVSPNLLSMR